MKEIELTQGQVALVDDDQYKFLMQWKWYARKDKNTFYAGRNSPKINGKRYMIHMHHEIIDRSSKGFEIDHKDGNGLNNQRKNLRFVTHRQNGQNRKDQKKSSKYLGVCWNKCARKWMATIKINGNTKYLGLFTNEKEAFETYCQAVEAIGEKMLEGAKL